jgi:CDP-ribitol ribitolphosphotransferase
VTRILSAIGIACAQVLYRGLGLLLRRKRKVVFLSRQTDEPSLDFQMLAEELRAQSRGVEVVTRCRRMRPGWTGRIAYLGEVLAQLRHLADSSVCVVDGYIIPVSVLEHRDELFVVQMWHALGAIKKFGYQALDRPAGRSSSVARAMRMHRNYDLVTCGGPASVPVFAEAFDVDPSLVRPLGLPRVDRMLERARDTFASSPVPEIRSLAERFPRLLDETTVRVLYAPTFRRDGASEWPSVVDAFATKRFTLLAKPHDLDETQVTGPHVVDASGTQIAELLPLCDAVVTDYSAVAFEAWALGKPVYFYVHDIEHYRQATGLNFDPEVEVPESTSRDINDIAELIERGAYNTDAARRLRDAYVPACAHGCTRQIAEAIVPHLRPRR